MVRGILFSFATVLFLFACGGDDKAADQQETENPEEEAANQGALEENEWDLIKYTADGQEYDVLKDAPAKLVFKGESLSGNSGCNSFMSSYTLGANGAIEVGAMNSTKMICANKMTQEVKFFELLKEAQSYSVQQNQLIIKSKNGELNFREAAQ